MFNIIINIKLMSYLKTLLVNFIIEKEVNLDDFW